MALTRFPCEKYASLELNQVGFPQHAVVISQTPLGAGFTAAAPAENGMVVSIDKSKGALNAPAAVTDALGIIYTAEKEYDSMHYGLKNFGRKIAGDYPRVGVLGLGDTMTSNCFQYDTTEFATFTALETALKAAATTAVYVVPVANSPVLKLTATKPNTGMVGVVTKYYTVPNGEKGIKYEIIRM